MKPNEKKVGTNSRFCAETTSPLLVSSAQFFTLRLFPGQELLTEIRSFAAQTGLKAGFIAAVVGSLSQVSLRYAGRSESFLTEGCFEVISLSGTLDAQGEHLHLSISNPQGQMLGGHVMEGCFVRTTLELVIGVLPGVLFSREQCAISGYPELKITQRSE